MFGISDIPRNGRVPGPITVVVRSVEETRPAETDALVTVEGAAGRSVPLTVWATHDLSPDWRVGHRYALEGVRGNRWTMDGETHYRLHTTRDFTAEDRGLATAGESRLLFVGDSHVGYEHRGREEKPRWARDVDTHGALRAVLATAAALDVDAVVHAGDVFDHEATTRDIERAASLLVDQRPRIPFHYVYGNHDWDAAREAMTSLAERDDHVHRLTTAPAPVGGAEVRLVGVDHAGGSLGDPLPVSTAGGGDAPTVLVVHESPYPARNTNTSKQYQMRGVDLDDLVARLSVEPDLVVCGHMHVADRTELPGTGVLLVVTGPTVPIGKPGEESPLCWLVTGTRHGLWVTPQSLRPSKPTDKP